MPAQAGIHDFLVLTRDRFTVLFERKDDEITMTENNDLRASAVRDLQIVEAIEAGLEDIKAGRYISHAEVMRDVRAEIEAAARNSDARD